MINENSKGAMSENHADMERFATETVSTWHGQLAKLKELAPAIDRIEKYFSDHVRGSVTLLGCSSFKEFCEKRLKRHRNTVYEMLRNYKAEKDGKAGETGKRKGKGGSNRDTLKQELAQAKADVERLLPVGQAAGKLAEATKAGNQAKKAEAEKELLFAVEAEPPTGLNAGDEPNTAMMLHELLAEIQRVGDRIFTVAPTLVRMHGAMVKRLNLQGKIGFVEQEKPKPKVPRAETPPDSIGNEDALREMGAALDQAEQVNADVRKKIVGDFTVMKRGKTFVAFNHTMPSGSKNTLCVGTEKECVAAAEAASAKEMPQVQAAAGSAL
jgi:hypothetical protein